MFTPALPTNKQNAMDNAEIWAGFKAFFEFSENFYDDGHEVSVNPTTDGQKLYYDATKGQNSDKNILGLFTVGKPALEYLNLTPKEIKDKILAELDSIFSNKATSAYVKHITQHWNEEPYVKAGYLVDHADSTTLTTLAESINNKVYFAGGAFTDGTDWVSVHTAARSAISAVKSLTA